MPTSFTEAVLASAAIIYAYQSYRAYRIILDSYRNHKDKLHTDILEAFNEGKWYDILLTASLMLLGLPFWIIRSILKKTRVIT